MTDQDHPHFEDFKDQLKDGSDKIQEYVKGELERVGMKSTNVSKRDYIAAIDSFMRVIGGKEEVWNPTDRALHMVIDLATVANLRIQSPLVAILTAAEIIRTAKASLKKELAKWKSLGLADDMTINWEEQLDRAFKDVSLVAGDMMVIFAAGIEAGVYDDLSIEDVLRNGLTDRGSDSKPA